MKVFISWSGDKSKAVAELIDSWISSVIQAIKPWISSQDIEAGSMWFSEISNQLNNNAIGIVCLTQENKNKPWILFEAGALAKGLSTSRVCTFLIDLEPKDIEDPLAQFNHTIPTKENMMKLASNLNKSLGEAALEAKILEKTFEKYWPDFENEFNLILKKHENPKKVEQRPENDILGEILENTRTLSNRIRKIEANSAEFSQLELLDKLAKIVSKKSSEQWHTDPYANINSALSSSVVADKVSSYEQSVRDVLAQYYLQTKKIM